MTKLNIVREILVRQKWDVDGATWNHVLTGEFLQLWSRMTHFLYDIPERDLYT